MYEYVLAHLCLCVLCLFPVQCISGYEHALVLLLLFLAGCCRKGQPYNKSTDDFSFPWGASPFSPSAFSSFFTVFLICSSLLSSFCPPSFYRTLPCSVKATVLSPRQPGKTYLVSVAFITPGQANPQSLTKKVLSLNCPHTDCNCKLRYITNSLQNKQYRLSIQ